MSESDQLTIGEIGRTLNRLERDIHGVATKLDGINTSTVSRGEWTVRNAQVDEAIAEIRARRVPWTAVGSLVVGAGGLGISLILALSGGP